MESGVISLDNDGASLRRGIIRAGAHNTKGAT